MGPGKLIEGGEPTDVGSHPMGLASPAGRRQTANVSKSEIGGSALYSSDPSLISYFDCEVSTSVLKEMHLKKHLNNHGLSIYQI